MTHQSHHSTRLRRAFARSLVMVATLTGIAPVAATAQAPTTPSDTLIIACYVPTSGTMYRIKVASTKNECTGQGVEFAWNALGLQGDIGPAGPAGPQGIPGLPGTVGSAFALPYAGSTSTDAPIAAFKITNTGTGAAGWFENTAATGTAIFATAASSKATLTATNTANGVAGNFSVTGPNNAIFASTSGTGNAINASTATGFASLFANNSGMGSVYAVFAQSSGSSAAVLAKNGGTGPALRAEVGNGNNAINVSNTGTGGGINVNVGAGTGISVNGTPATGINVNGPGNGMIVSSTGTGSTQALSVQSAGTNATLNAVNVGTGSAGHMNSANQFNTLFVRNTGAGSGIVSANSADFTTIAAENTGTGSAGGFKSAGTNTTVSAVNTGSGGAMNMSSVNGTTLMLTHTGGGTGNGALSATSSAQNTASFLNYGTGNNIALVARSFGEWPTPQFANEKIGGGGVALRVQGSADITGDFTVYGNSVVTGSKNAIVPTSRGMTKVYSEESSEVWFSEYGEGRLRNGVVTIPIEALFGETIDLNAKYHVFLQANDDATLFVAARTKSGFTVSARDGMRDASFSYRLVAKRKGYANERLQVIEK